MARRNIHYWLIKLVRLSGWLLLPLMVIYLVTGFSLCGQFGIDQWIDDAVALALHRLLEWPLVGIFLVHVVIAIYFALRRWGWIKSRTCR